MSKFYLFVAFFALVLSAGPLTAQNVTVSASIGLADDQCSFPINDPDTDCINVPNGNDNLVYIPGQDGQIIITYRILNNAGGTINSVLITDSDRGTVLPVSAITIPPGGVYVTNRIFPAETVARMVTPTVSATVENLAGNSLTVTNNYDFKVAGPEAQVEVFILEAGGFCVDTTDLASCPVAPSTTPNTITVAPGTPLYREYRLQNIGDAPFGDHEWDDSRYGITATPANANPGADLRFRAIVPAPTVPGNYPITVEYEGSDDFGNTVMLTTNYTIIVADLEAAVEVFLLEAEGFCTDTTDLATCPVAPNTTPNTITVAPGTPLYREYRMQNTGIARIKFHEWDDSRYGITYNPANANPGADLRFRAIVPAPTVPGTYPITVEYEGSDDFGNTVMLTTNYTIIVADLEAAVEVFLLEAEGFCTDTTDLATCPVAPNTTPNTITVAPGTPIYREYRMQNTGIARIKFHEWDDSRYGITYNPANANPGADLRFRAIVPAPTVPGTYPITVEYEGSDDFGNTVMLTTNYTIIVADLEAAVEVFLLEAEGFCTDTTDLATCPVAPNTTPNTITVAPGTPLYREYRMQNTGIARIKFHEWDDSRYGITYNPANANPGADLRFRAIVPAPTVPGTYPITVEYEGSDDFGNTVMLTTNYTIIVADLEAAVEVFLLEAEGFCTDTTDLATCPVAPNTTPNTITVAPGTPIYREYRMQNTGIARIKFHEWDDSRYGITYNPANANPGADLRFRAIVPAPTVPGTYPITVEYEGSDDFGNLVNRTTNYTIIVDCALGDQVPPTALCQPLEISIIDDETVSILASQIDNGSFDNCGGISGGLNQSDFTCADLGVNPVTLTINDDAGNSASCQANVTVTADEYVANGPIATCTSITQTLDAPFEFFDVTGPQGKLIASVRKNVNPNVASIRLDLYREAALTEGNASERRLSKRMTLTPLNAAGQPVNPLTPMNIRLYFRDVEIEALETETGVDRSLFGLVKDDSECGAGGFTGDNAVVLNTVYNTTGCANVTQYYQTSALQFSTFFLWANPAVLPVEWLSFQARPRGEQVLLDWATASEANNAQFIIEHSTDGRTFQAIGQVVGAGNTTSQRDYQYLHEQAVKGNNYYRVRQQDYDGASSLSEVRLVSMQANDPVVTVYPNPTADVLYLQGLEAGPVRIVNGQGRTILSRDYQVGEAISVIRLPAGKYVLLAGGQAIRWVKI